MTQVTTLGHGSRLFFLVFFFLRSSGQSGTLLYKTLNTIANVTTFPRPWRAFLSLPAPHPPRPHQTPRPSFNMGASDLLTTLRASRSADADAMWRTVESIAKAVDNAIAAPQLPLPTTKSGSPSASGP